MRIVIYALGLKIIIVLEAVMYITLMNNYHVWYGRLTSTTEKVEASMDILQAELGSISKDSDKKSLKLEKVQADFIIHKAGGKQEVVYVCECVCTYIHFPHISSSLCFHTNVISG